MNNYENLINTVLDDRYKLVAVAGTGGMAVVFEADDLAMKRRVAVKILKDDIKEDERELKRFINESRAIAMLSHPNIVQVFDVFVRPEGEHQYIVMEFIDGITLKDYISKKGRLNWKEAIGYTEQVLSALSHAHEKGIIHRDVKPQNIMLLRNGSLKITDFGIAKIPNSEQLTMTDKAIGTVHYISPEQASGNGNISTVSDIYSVGIILYEMTAGKLPFEGNTAIQVAMMQIKDDPQDPRVINPEMPKGLSQIILKAMSKSAYDRYRTAVEMIKQLGIIKANPAAVFNYSNSNNAGNKNGTGNNLPVEIGKEQKKDAVRVQNNKDIEQIEEAELDEEEMRKKGRNSKKTVRRRSSRSMLPIISGVTLAFLIVLGVSLTNILLAFFTENSERADNEETIPDYIGRHFGEYVEPDMANRRVTVGEIRYENNDNFEENEVISHFPEPGEVKRWSGRDIRIDFVISKGRELYIVEDLAVTEYRQVRIQLEARGIIPVEKSVPDDTIPSNYIIRTEPGPGTFLRSGDEITIYVSSGHTPNRVIMPDVVGMSRRDAERELARLEIVIREIVPEYSDRYDPGYITEQSITATRQVLAKSTRVTLHISKGPRPLTPEEIEELEREREREEREEENTEARIE